MDERFEIPVTYQDRDLLFTAKLLAFGFTHKFQVDVFGQNLFFELDDAGKYRALINLANLEEAKKLDVNLLKAIAAAIESILK